MTSTILICTVGGSHQPIVTACRELRPDFVCFICSGKDPGTGRPGSDIQITGKDLCIKAHPGDEKASLPNVPAQLGLKPEACQIVTVPSDDLDAAVLVIRQAIDDLTRRFPDAQIKADYTGGTKTMTAALVTAVLETDTVDLQLVTGNRADLVKVRNGTESSTRANIDTIRLDRAMAPFLQAWSRFAYDEAGEGLAALRAPQSTDLRARLARARDLSRAFAAWDRFDHCEAQRLLEIYAPVVSQELGTHLGALRLLTSAGPSQEPMRLFDLWRNAERRAGQGRFDDAVARAYRLIEWSAQWLLRSNFAIDTSDIPAAQIPEGMEIPANREGKHQAGLSAAWELIRRLAPSESPSGSFANSQRSAMLNLIKIRNVSILAHGFTPIGQENWEEFHTWMNTVFLPMLLAEVKQNKELRLHSLPPQLPVFYCW